MSWSIFWCHSCAVWSVLLAAVVGLYMSLSKHVFCAASPATTPIQLPVVGDLRYFWRRWGIFQNSVYEDGSNRNFSFRLGPYPIIALRGAEMRRVFFEDKHLDPMEGYGPLLNSGPQVDPNMKHPNLSKGYGKWFANRMRMILGRNNLRVYLPQVLHDIQISFTKMGATGFLDPFDNIYQLSFQLSMRMFGCNEIAQSPNRSNEVMRLFEAIERFHSPLSIILPWVPNLWTLIRFRYNLKLVSIFSDCLQKRQDERREEVDGPQMLLNAGDDITNIIHLTLSSLFASISDAGVNAASILCFLGASPEWKQQCLEEVKRVVRENCPIDLDQAPVMEKLAYLPLEVWEEEFPLCDLCIRESIRLNLLGCLFRRHVGKDHIVLPNENGTVEVIRPGDYVAYNMVDAHYDSSIYAKPDEFDPSRYMIDRAEDKTQPLAYLGWGAGRHPCKGSTYVSQMLRMILAAFVMSFDWTLTDVKGKPLKRTPRIDLNGWGSTKWKNVRLQYHRRSDV